MFLIIGPQIVEEANYFAQSPVDSWGIPVQFTGLIWNILSQCVCIFAVHRLTAHYSSLTTNLILTLRKCVSLLISVMHFGSYISSIQCVGTLLVLVGTLMYATAPKPDIVHSKASQPSAPAKPKHGARRLESPRIGKKLD
jgi:UDP-xylose/UDP-N-acetylglucosamine transporter B4